MKVLVKDYSVAQVAEPSIIIRGGKVVYDLNFRCAHEDAYLSYEPDAEPFASVGVYCPGCKGEELSDEDREDILSDD